MRTLSRGAVAKQHLPHPHLCDPARWAFFIIGNHSFHSLMQHGVSYDKKRASNSLDALKINAGDRNRTGTVSPQQDFKSCASASSATPAYLIDKKSIATYVRIPIRSFPSLTSCGKIHPYRTILNGQRWIRTTEAICSRFTVCPLWPLGNLPIHQISSDNNRL